LNGAGCADAAPTVSAQANNTATQHLIEFIVVSLPGPTRRC